MWRIFVLWEYLQLRQSSGRFACIPTNGTATAAAIAPTDNNPFVGFQALQFLPQVLGFPTKQSLEPPTTVKLLTQQVSHAFTDNLNVYLTYGTGFKGTSWNLSRDSLPTAEERDGILAAGGTLPNNLETDAFTGPEEAETIELGFKYSSDWGTLNAALFDQSITGFRRTFLGTGFALKTQVNNQQRGAESI